MTSYIKVSNLYYSYPNDKEIFKNISFTISTLEKTAIVGANGCGKTTLFKLIAGELSPNSGIIFHNISISTVKQDLSLFSDSIVSVALGIYSKIQIINRICEGNARNEDYDLVQNDWDIENRAKEILHILGLPNVALERKFSTLSGGEANLVIFASCLLSNSDYILFDEPTNHLGLNSREKFYDLIKKSKKGMLIISHDKRLLRFADTTLEISCNGIKTYGGNFDFYN